MHICGMVAFFHIKANSSCTQSRDFWMQQHAHTYADVYSPGCGSCKYAQTSLAHNCYHCRDQRALSQQVDKLQQSLTSIQEQHDQQMASAQAAHLQQLQDIRAELETRQQQWVRAG